MRLLLTFLVFSCFSCSNPALIDEPQDPQPMDDPTGAYTYLALGDSYTIGTSVAIEDRWPVQLVDRLNEDSLLVDEPRIIARVGWSTDQLISAIEGASADLDSVYDMVSLLIGVNNQYRGYPLSQYRRELPELLETAIRYAGGEKAHVFMLSIPDYGLTPFGQNQDPEKIAAELDEYNAIADSLCQAYEIAFYDITGVSREYGSDAEYVATDELHPSGKMYKAWVSAVYPEVKMIVEP